jgi:hypothetical protein
MAKVSRYLEPTPTRGDAPSHAPPDTHYIPGIRLARALGWFSVALGVTQIFARRRVARWIGVREHPVLLPLLGAREVATGATILRSGRPTVPMWGRVAGDGMDLALLIGALLSRRANRRRVAVVTAAVAAVTLLDVLASTGMTAAAVMEGRA